jgi:UDP-glucose 6-dehydrogenase
VSTHEDRCRGTGHVGLVTSVVLAHLGHEVAAMDSDAEKILLLQGVPPRSTSPG